MNDRIIPRARTVSLKVIVWSFVLCMAATAAYMTWVIKAVPRTVSNSKAGIFAELVEDLLDVYEHETNLVLAPSFEPINELIKEKFKESPLALRPAPRWILRSWADASVHGRPMLLVRYDSTDGMSKKLLLALVPISKRNFPRTGGFSYKDAWFFTFGRDYPAPAADAAFPKKQLESHLSEISKLEQEGLNLVATNYGNDFYIVMLSSLDSKELAKDLFLMSTIFETAPQ